MIKVHIYENNGLVANCIITGQEDEFRADLARIKSIPFDDRSFVDDVEPKYWRIRNAEGHANKVFEIKEAITLYKKQMRFSI